MRILFLDDERIPKDVLRPERVPYAVVARTVEEALEILQTQEITHWSLDHDLGGDATGMQFLKIVQEKYLDKWPPIENINVHSANPVGARNMRMYIRSVNVHLIVK